MCGDTRARGSGAAVGGVLVPIVRGARQGREAPVPSTESPRVAVVLEQPRMDAEGEAEPSGMAGGGATGPRRVKSELR
jgi:hypothetical protein